MARQEAATVARERVEPGVVAGLLDELPDWFGIESANTAYERDARMFDTFAAHTTTVRWWVCSCCGGGSPSRRTCT